jgi:hypothetical protein
VTFTPTDATNYTSVTTTVNVTVAKATPTITVAPTASGIIYGQTLASSTLSQGTASTAGTFTFTTPSTAPNAGISEHGVTFTPSSTALFNTITTTVLVRVAKATIKIDRSDFVRIDIILLFVVMDVRATELLRREKSGTRSRPPTLFIRKNSKFTVPRAPA